MKILALEFSSSQRSVAVLNVDAHANVLATSQVMEAASGNTMRPLGMIEAALRDAGLERDQIECLVVGLGPGSYNGIRVAISLAQGWQLASEIKLLGVSSADCVAAQSHADGRTGKVAVVIDAQRGEYYLAAYELSTRGWRVTSRLRLASADEVRARQWSGAALIGPDVTRWFPGGQPVFPRATMLGHLAKGRRDFVPAEKLEPIYLREARFVKAPPPRMVSG